MSKSTFTGKSESNKPRIRAVYHTLGLYFSQWYRGSQDLKVFINSASVLHRVTSFVSNKCRDLHGLSNTTLTHKRLTAGYYFHEIAKVLKAKNIYYGSENTEKHCFCR